MPRQFAEPRALDRLPTERPVSLPIIDFELDLDRGALYYTVEATHGARAGIWRHSIEALADPL